MQIDDSEGADSSLKISCDYEEFNAFIEYCNGAVEYDDESGLYMPITEDEIEDIDNAVDEILDLIRRELTSYMDIVEQEDVTHGLIVMKKEALLMKLLFVKIVWIYWKRNNVILFLLFNWLIYLLEKHVEIHVLWYII